MNHLAALALKSPWPHEPLTEAEQAALAQFRSAHNSEAGAEASEPTWNLSHWNTF